MKKEQLEPLVEAVRSNLFGLVALFGTIACGVVAPKIETWMSGILDSTTLFRLLCVSIGALFFSLLYILALHGRESLLDVELSVHDKKLIEDFQTQLPTADILAILKEHDFGGTLRRSDMEPFWRFRSVWKGVEYQFDDLTLEKARKAFHERLLVFTEAVGKYMVTDTKPSEALLRILPPDGDPDSKHNPRTAQIMNDAASDAFLAHQEFALFIRKAKR